LTARVAQVLCGVTRQFRAAGSGLSDPAGSRANRSAAPASRPWFNASARSSYLAGCPAEQEGEFLRRFQQSVAPAFRRGGHLSRSEGRPCPGAQTERRAGPEVGQGPTLGVRSPGPAAWPLRLGGESKRVVTDR